ncbi:hypothetical protein GEV33_012760 [Tenebrio molitor]|uniref:Uncharacterized protein n=1 Tax=Tenebrio molitor TaxID=7067 RepID=A0A8J6H972_TENMO|nr:hypothetical protein GEV33_012760 [Tenebrio molitor]
MCAIKEMKFPTIHYLVVRGSRVDLCPFKSAVSHGFHHTSSILVCPADRTPETAQCDRSEPGSSRCVMSPILEHSRTQPRKQVEGGTDYFRFSKKKFHYLLGVHVIPKNDSDFVECIWGLYSSASSLHSSGTFIWEIRGVDTLKKSLSQQIKTETLSNDIKHTGGKGQVALFFRRVSSPFLNCRVEKSTSAPPQQQEVKVSEVPDRSNKDFNRSVFIESMFMTTRAIKKQIKAKRQLLYRYGPASVTTTIGATLIAILPCRGRSSFFTRRTARRGGHAAWSPCASATCEYVNKLIYRPCNVHYATASRLGVGVRENGTSSVIIRSKEDDRNLVLSSAKLRHTLAADQTVRVAVDAAIRVGNCKPQDATELVKSKIYHDPFTPFEEATSAGQSCCGRHLQGAPDLVPLTYLDTDLWYDTNVIERAIHDFSRSSHAAALFYVTYVGENRSSARRPHSKMASATSMCNTHNLTLARSHRPDAHELDPCRGDGGGASGHRKATYERVGPPGGDLVLLGGGVVLQGRGVGTKRGQNTFYSIQQTQSLICKSDNTPNYQVNMAILYGRWKEVSIWLPESETALPSPLGSEEDGLHIDIIRRAELIFPGPNDHPRPKTAPPMTAAGDFNAHTSHMEDTHTPPRGGQPAEEIEMEKLAASQNVSSILLPIKLIVECDVGWEPSGREAETSVAASSATRDARVATAAASSTYDKYIFYTACFGLMC